MGQDDDADCVGHLWQLRGVVLDRGAEAEYECARPGCGALLVKTADDPFPESI